MAHAARTWTIRIVAACAILGLAFGAGAWHGSIKLDQQKTHYETALENAQQEAGKLQAELSAERAKLGQLEARRRLHLALAALEQKNFGIAQTELERAAAFLDRSRPDAGTPVSKLQAQIKGYKIIASEDVSKEREMIQGWLRRFDELLPPADP
jgi:hypothetical protein